MAIRFYVLGKTREDYFLGSESEYLKRIDKYCSFHYEVLQASRGDSDPSSCRLFEEKQILKRIPDAHFMVLLDEQGQSYTSSEFAVQLNHWMNQQSDLDFLVGGAFGVTEKVKERANLKLRLSDMTMPHHLVRTVFLEQLYRAFTILRNEKYHNP